jgi:TonB family protein
MIRTDIKQLFWISFLISLLLHLLLFLIFSTTIFFNITEPKKPPNHYVPAYVQQEAIRSRQSISIATMKPTKSIQAQKNKPSKSFPKQSVLSLTYAMLNQRQQAMIASLNKKQDPIYLIGDQNQTADALTRLLGRALSTHFAYPKEAGMLGIKGKVIIGMDLHSNGELSDIQILQSSHYADLDAAALYAVNRAPTVKGADKFISRVRHFVVGFVFR